jgi:hypothetical protein
VVNTSLPIEKLFDYGPVVPFVGELKTFIFRL